MGGGGGLGELLLGGGGFCVGVGMCVCVNFFSLCYAIRFLYFISAAVGRFNRAAQGLHMS